MLCRILAIVLFLAAVSSCKPAADRPYLAAADRAKTRRVIFPDTPFTR